MTVVRTAPDTIALIGACPSADAETLAAAMIETPSASVDWRGCDSAHTAVVQILMASGAAMKGPPQGDFLAEHIAPLLSASAR